MKNIVFGSVIFSLLVSIFIIFSNPSQPQANFQADFSIQMKEEDDNLKYSAAALPSFADLVEDAMPAVVNISTTQNVKVSSNPFEDFFKREMPEGGQFDLFREFFEREYDGNGGQQRTKKATSLGSGFIVDPSGYVVTNNHVIAEADEIHVIITKDGEDKTYDAKLIGSDKKTDLAVLKIESKKPFPSLRFGSSKNARVGDWVITIGNPFGLGGTVTTGIISAKSRFIAGQFDEFIQTDASINRGNSGGPLINLQGRVIGVNSVIISPSGGNVGIGLSIPSNSAAPIIKQLIEKGSITRGWLGVKIQPVTDDIAKNLGLPSAKGALVAEIIKDSPAAKSTIKLGDVIMKFDGKPISSMQKLPRIVAETKIGKKVQVEVMRNGKKEVLTVVVEKTETSEAETMKSKEKPGTEKETKGSSKVLGMKVDNITQLTRQKYKLDKAASGVIVTKIDRNSAGVDVGIHIGDLIKRFNNTNITDVASLQKAVKSAKSSGAKNAVMLVSRNGSNQFIVIDIE